MSSYYSYSDDDDIDIRVASRRRSPPVQYVQPPQHYYAREPSPAYLDAGRTVIPVRSVSRDRSRGRRASSPPAPAPPPVVINNRIYHDYSSDDDERCHLQVAKRARSRSRSRTSGHVMTREEFEMERARRELASLKMSNEMEERQRRTAKELQEEAELRRARDELEEIKAARAREEEEKRIKKELEFKRLKEEEREAEEQERREKEAEEAVERYKQKELERVAMERKEKECREREYQRRLQEQLVQSGLNGDQVEAILKNEKLPEPKSDKPKPQYTRMLRKHLSLETLRTFEIEYAVDDQDANYVLVKRWVPEWEQKTLWKHTKLVREKRSKLILSVDDGEHRHRHRHRHQDSDFEWVRRKSPRRRSKSPSLLLYLAGARPA